MYQAKLSVPLFSFSRIILVVSPFQLFLMAKKILQSQSFYTLLLNTQVFPILSSIGALCIDIVHG